MERAVIILCSGKHDLHDNTIKEVIGVAKMESPRCYTTYTRLAVRRLWFS